jgi:hypothetical protein
MGPSILPKKIDNSIQYFASYKWALRFVKKEVKNELIVRRPTKTYPKMSV